MPQFIKSGVLCKRSVVKGRRFQTENYKDRLFRLTDDTLNYYEGDLNKCGRQCGSISLSSMKVVMEVEDGKLEDKKNVFQIVYAEKNDFCTLYVVAKTSLEKYAWLETIRSYAQRKRADFFGKYHPGVWTKKQPYYNCCHQSDRNAVGCKCDSISQAPAPPPTPPPRPDTVNNKVYIAMFDYEPTDNWGLELIQGEKYTILDDSAESWWKAEAKDGSVGYIPSNYIKLNCGLEVFEWYYKDCSRERSKTLLMQCGKEGCFLVRDSVSSPGDYTLSIFTPEHDGNVRHYQIKQNELGQYYVSVNYPHNSIQDLVHYHKHNAGGIYTRLREPPPRGDKPSTAGLGRGQWKLDLAKLKKGRELGRGCFGVVYEGTYMRGKHPIPVAIKVITVKAYSDEVFQEFRTMTQLNHPNLVQLYGAVLDAEPQMIVTELLEHGALNGYLQRYKPKLFYSQTKLMDFAIQVCSGMEYLDKKQIIHRDLAARNCLVSGDEVVKVGDFGLARIVLEDDEYQMSEGTKFPFKWAPPEVLYHRKFSSKSDIWAYGILLWEIYSFGEMPYTGMKNPEVLKYVAEEGKRLKKPRSAPSLLYDIMNQCWAILPAERPTFTIIRKNLERLNAKTDYIATEISPNRG